MNKYKYSSLLLVVFGASILTVADAAAATDKKTGAKNKVVAKKVVSAKPKKLTKAQQAAEARRAAEARAKAEQEARARAEQEARARAEAEAKARAAAEEKARVEAEAKAQRDAEIAAREKPLTDAETLMKDGKPAEAYALLEPLDFERSGEVRFDYLLGISALDSGKPDKATLAFERVLAVNPNFAGARLDMARAYYQLGDLPRARTEFETVLKQNPPEAARTTIQKYLDAIAAQEQSKQTQLSGYMEGTLGYDGNVNSGTGSTISFSSLGPGGAYLINFVGNQTISPTKRSNNYYGVAEGIDISRSLNANWSMSAGADLRLRGNMAKALGVYDSVGMAVRGGVMYANGSNAYRLTLSDGQTFTGQTLRTDSLGANAEWQHIFSPSNQMSVFGQFGQNRAYGYQATDTATPKTDVRIEGNLDTVVAGAGWVHVSADGRKVLFGSVSSGNELDVAQRIDGKKRFDSLRIGGQLAVTDRIEGVTSLGWTHARYTGANVFIPNNGSRKEDQYDLTVGANWHLDMFWTVKPQLAYSKKNSNLALYSFNRMDASLTVRRDFR